MIWANVYNRRKWCHKWSHSCSVTSSNRFVRLQSCEKEMDWCTAQCKILLFCARTIVKGSSKFELACLKKKIKERCLAIRQLSVSVLLWCFFAPLGILFVMKTVEVEWYMVAYMFIVFEFLRDYFALSYVECLCYPYIYSLPTLWHTGITEFSSSFNICGYSIDI